MHWDLADQEIITIVLLLDMLYIVCLHGALGVILTIDAALMMEEIVRYAITYLVREVIIILCYQCSASNLLNLLTFQYNTPNAYFQY